MTDKTPLERAARAMVKRNCPGASETEIDDMWIDWVEDARVAIEAIREPNEAMVEEGRWPAEDDGPVACWQAMIDAALSEEGYGF